MVSGGEASSSGSEVDSSGAQSSLQQFLALSKSCKGLAAVELIKQVLNHPQIYVFGELLSQPSIKDLANDPNHSSFYNLLELFAYGVYKDFDSTKYPPLTPAMVQKLRNLTIVSLANSSKIISYQKLSEELGIDNLRDLENLIMDVIYSNIIKGKMDQQNRWLEISSTISRDIREGQLGNIIGILSDWCNNCDSVIVDIETQINKANSVKADHIQKKKELEQKINQIEMQLKSTHQEVDYSGDNIDVNMVMPSKDSSTGNRNKRFTRKPARLPGAPKPSGSGSLTMD
ncbi:COP9 signalosome subunit 7 [Brevipalpus obovatus]|uniref:COP9 signalosome subunit 7 n=1 Tax=Brevipalpus obovatus TaxID=246614 RepID=UPI003D9F622E